ncbi:immunoglobulin-like domain-containing protein [Lachnospiraceae bacterium 66-29]
MKTRTILRRIITILISLVLCITITDTTSFAKSKAKPTISDTKVTMNTNEEYCISLDRASSKVTWKSSNRKLVKIENGKKSKNVLEKVTQTKQSLMIRYKMCAASYHPKNDSPAAYGNAIQIEKYSNGQWHEVPMKIGIVFPCPMFTIPPQTSIRKAIHLETYYDISKLTAGSYRLNVNVFYPDVTNPYVKFKLK